MSQNTSSIESSATAAAVSVTASGGDGTAVNTTTSESATPVSASAVGHTSETKYVHPAVRAAAAVNAALIAVDTAPSSVDGTMVILRMIVQILAALQQGLLPGYNLGLEPSRLERDEEGKMFIPVLTAHEALSQINASSSTQIYTKVCDDTGPPHAPIWTAIWSKNGTVVATAQGSKKAWAINDCAKIVCEQDDIYYIERPRPTSASTSVVQLPSIGHAQEDGNGDDGDTDAVDDSINTSKEHGEESQSGGGGEGGSALV